MSDKHQSDEQLDQVYDVMKGESDRGCVLVGASLIEWQMGELLRATFRKQHSGSNEDMSKIYEQINKMLDPLNEKSILGGAAARGRMCRVLGLISEPIHKLLKEFLSFRNAHFAHARSEVRFEDELIKRNLDRLVALIPEGFGASRMLKGLSLERSQFAKIVVVLFYCLDHRCQDNRAEYELPSP